MQEKELYDHRKRPIGTYKMKKKNGTVAVRFNPGTYHADVDLDLDEFDAYRRRFGFLTEFELGQLELF